MRECKIDNVKVIARNSCTLSFATRVIKSGTFFTYDDGSGNMLARSLGRVNSVNDGLEPCKNYVLAMVLARDATFAYVRWVNPDHITIAYESPPSKLAQFFFAPTLPYDTKNMLALMAHGTVSESFIENAPQRVKMFKTRGAPFSEPAQVYDTFDGKYHSVDESDADAKTATTRTGQDRRARRRSAMLARLAK